MNLFLKQRPRCCTRTWVGCREWIAMMNGKRWDTWDVQRSWRHARGDCGMNISASRAGGEPPAPGPQKCKDSDRPSVKSNPDNRANRPLNFVHVPHGS